jgi:hypothetical protein
MKTLRHAQIRAYFFGHGENALAPHSQSANYDDLTIFKINESMYPLHLVDLPMIDAALQAQTPPHTDLTTMTMSTPHQRRSTNA